MQYILPLAYSIETSQMLRQALNHAGDSDLESYNGGLLAIAVSSSGVCKFALVGDAYDDCRVNLHDFAMMAANWPINCSVTPVNPAGLS